jgi:hypothetical protein
MQEKPAIPIKAQEQVQVLIDEFNRREVSLFGSHRPL